MKVLSKYLNDESLKLTTLTEWKIVFFLLLFSFVLGSLYVFLTPPWQAPDEITHYEYIDILSHAKIFMIKQKPDYNLQKEIIKSMDKFNAWEYVYREAPSPLPEKFIDFPVYRESILKVNRPPLYYILSSLLLKTFKTDNLLLKHYIIRLFSLFLSLFTILFVFLSAKIVFNGNFFYSIAAACFLAFLPQFMISSSSINSDNLANLVGAFSIYIFLFSLKHLRNHYILLTFPFILIIAFSTGSTTFFLIPFLVVFCIIYLLKSQKSNRSGIILLIAIIISIFLIVYLFFHIIFSELGKRLAENYLPWLISWIRIFHGNYHVRFDKPFILMLFKSFWCYAGWMAFPLPNYIYRILEVVSLFGFLGIIKYILLKLFKVRQRFPVKVDYFILLVSFCFFSLAAVFFRGVPMARYFFPALSACAILFILGFKELIPFKSDKIALISLILSLAVFNVYTIFNHIINVFYFHFW